MFGALLDAIQLGLGLVDFASDAAVAFEFYSAGFMGWFWTLVLLHMTASLAESFILVLQLYDNNLDLDKFFQWAPLTVILSPFSPFFAIAHYIGNKLGVSWACRLEGSIQAADWNDDGSTAADLLKTKKRMNNGNGRVEWDIDREQSEQQHDHLPYPDLKRMLAARSGRNGGGGDASSEFSKVDATTRSTLKALDTALVTRQAAFFLSTVGAVLQSIPQSLAQLLFIGMTDKPSLIQSISLMLTLVGLSLKVTYISRTFCIKSLISRVLFAVHDIFSLSFLFSCLLTAAPVVFAATSAITTVTVSEFGVVEESITVTNEPTTLTAFGLPVSSVLAQLWIYQKVASVVVISIFGWSWFLWIIFFEDPNVQGRWKIIMVYVLMYVSLLVPVVVAHELLCRFSLITLIAGIVTPNAEDLPLVPALHNYLWKSSGVSQAEPTDWRATLAAARLMLAERVERTQTRAHARNFNPRLYYHLSLRSCFQQSQRSPDVFESTNKIDSDNSRSESTPASPPPQRVDTWRSRLVQLIFMKYLSMHLAHNSVESEVLIAPAGAARHNLMWTLIDFDRSLMPVLEKLASPGNDRCHGSNSFVVLASAFGPENVQRMVLDSVRSERDQRDLDGSFSSEARLMCLVLKQIVASIIADFTNKNNNNTAANTGNTRLMPRPRRNRVVSPREYFALSGATILGAISLLTAASSILFELLYPLMHWRSLFTHNDAGEFQPTFQLLMLVPTLIGLIGSLAYFKPAVQYVVTCFLWNAFCDRRAKLVEVTIDSYFSLSLHSLRSAAEISSNAIPADCFTQHVARFLPGPKSVGLWGIRPGREFEDLAAKNVE